MQGWPWESTGGRPVRRSGDELGVLVVAQTAEVARHVARQLQAAAPSRHTLQISASCADAERMLRSGSTAFADLPPTTGDRIDVVLLDPYVADATGIDALERLRRASPTVPIVVMADARGTGALDDGGVESLALELLARGAQELVPLDRVDPPAFWRTLERAVARHSVVAALERSREAAAHRATHDPLTGLPNRQLFLDRLDQALMLSGRYGRKTGVLFIDLDDFKAINDSYGHVVGDQLLASMATRLLRCVRKSDAVGRLGGDEFTVLLPDVRSRRDLLHVQRTIGAALLAPHELGDGLVLPVRASIGAAMAPLDGESPRALLEAADAAMYRAKEAMLPAPSVDHPSTGEFVRIGTPTTSSIETSHSPITEDELRQALARGEFAVHYQPIVDAVTERITAVEALLRWRSPSRGTVDAGRFLPLAEDTGLIVPIGDLVLESAAHAARRWRERLGEGGTAFRVHVNVSPIQLKERDVTSRVARALAGAQCPADAITLEISERCALPDAHPVLDTLEELRRIGVRLVVDDFGVGYSSLAFLRTAPVHAVKIDRSFVQRLTTDNRDVAIVSSIIRLARGLGLGVIAEGVESEGQAKLLRFQRCAQLQGWLFGDAVTTDAIDAMFAAPRRVGRDDDSAVVSPSQDGPSLDYAASLG
jgi:diguanylate cyclase (GGDEF)-like protein